MNNTTFTNKQMIKFENFLMYDKLELILEKKGYQKVIYYNLPILENTLPCYFKFLNKKE